MNNVISIPIDFNKKKTSDIWTIITSLAGECCEKNPKSKEYIKAIIELVDIVCIRQDKKIYFADEDMQNRIEEKRSAFAPLKNGRWRFIHRIETSMGNKTSQVVLEGSNKDLAGLPPILKHKFYGCDK